MGRVLLGMLGAAGVLALTGCDSGHGVANRSKQAHEPVVYATAVTSPDGKRIAVVTHNRTAIEVGPARGGHRRTIFRSAPAGITTDLYWASPHLIVFGDTDFEVSTIDVRTRRVFQIATADSFSLSSDERWVAWWQSGGITGPGTVGIVSVDGHQNCRFLPGPANTQDLGAFFKPGVQRLFFTREPYDPSTGQSKGPSRLMSVPISSLCYRP
jgi:hypothetical protein